MKEVAKYSKCFVCGDNNDNGLKIRFLADVHGAIAHYTVEDRFQGYMGILHGGITSTLLDEIMVKAVYAHGVVAVTAEMTVRFKKPIRTDDRLTLTARVIEKRERVFTAQGEIHRQDGELVASSSAKYLVVSGPLKDELTRSLDV